jgi:hypothetical protein
LLDGTFLGCPGGAASLPFVFNGIPPITFVYAINGVPQIPVLAQDVNFTLPVNPANSGTYTLLSMTDANGCSGVVSGSATVGISPAPQISANVTQPDCNGGANGALTLTVVGGVPPFSYLWSNNSTAQNQGNLAAGTYTVTVTDASGCSSFQSFALGGLPDLGLVSTGLLTCLTTTQTLIASPATGATYAWSNGATPVANSNQATVNTPGTYAVTVTNSTNGCTGVATVNVLQDIALPTVSLTQSGSLGCGSAQATLTASVNAVGIPVTFAWSAGTPVLGTNTATVTAAGTYFVTVTNSFTGCTATASITVAQNPSAGITAVNATVTNASCANTATGAISLSVVGGAAPYTYDWQHMGGNSNPANLSNLAPGTYVVTVTDANGCTRSATAVVTASPLIATAFSSVPPTCNNTFDGSIDLSVTGGVPPYQYLWSTGSSTEDLTGLSAGNYTVTVTDANGCTRVAVRGLKAFDVIMQTSVANCLANFSTDVSNGGGGQYTYLWSDGSTAPTLVGGTIGTVYTVTVTDGNGCTATATGSVAIQVPAPQANIIVSQLPCNGFLTAQLLGGVGGVLHQYQWSNGATSVNITNLAAGTYTVTITAGNTGCTYTASQTIAAPLISADINESFLITQPSCFGRTDGALNLTVQGNTAPYTFQWSNGAFTEDISGLPAGIYTVTITDANGCTRVTGRTLIQPAQLVISGLPTPAGCNNTGGGILAQVSGGTQPYAYAWSNGSNTAVVSNLAAGNYVLTVTDANGCTNTGSFVVGQAPLPSIGINLLSLGCNGALLGPAFAGGLVPSAYVWSDGNTVVSTTLNASVSSSGLYTLVATYANGCTASASIFVDIPASGPCGTIEGRVILDFDDDCALDNGETGLANWLVRAESSSDTLYGSSAVNGAFSIAVPPGTYTLVAISPSAPWLLCSPAPVVSVAANATATADIFADGEVPCPAMNISIGSTVLRRCFDNNTVFVNYCNTGTAPAEDAFVIVTLDPLLSVASALLPYTDLGGGQYRFDLGDVAVNSCGNFWFKVAVSCNAQLGQTLCMEATVSPNGDCAPPSAQWSGASLRLSSQCQNGELRFEVRNVGSAPSVAGLDYIVVEDAVMRMQSPLPSIPQGTAIQLAYPANGSTWRLEVDQEPFHPGLSMPMLSVEGCGTNNAGAFSLGFLPQFPSNDADPWVDIDCRTVTGAFDPNDKQGFPIGYGAERYIRPGTELDYMIRFQNTGNDTAFTVRILDTLSQWLDPATLVPGASSHAYQFKMRGEGIAEFLFQNILLPDSNVNFEASNGFVRFRIQHRADAPLETLLENSAAIYFDFNEPIITNTTRHRLGENFMTVRAWQPERPRYTVRVSPNPFVEEALLQVEGLDNEGPVFLQIFDNQGKILREMTAPGASFTLKRGDLPEGLLLFRLSQNGQPIGSGKLMLR